MAAEREITFEYDKDGDVLYVSVGTGEPSYVEEIDDVLVLEKGFYSHQITGFRIIGAQLHKVELRLRLEEAIPKAIEQEKSEIASSLIERERMFSDFIGTFDQRLSKEISTLA